MKRLFLLIINMEGKGLEKNQILPVRVVERPLCWDAGFIYQSDGLHKNLPQMKL